MVNIKRKLSFYLFTLILFIFILTPMVANGEALKVFDDANLFSEEEIMDLNDEANIISNTYDMDIIILTTDDANGKTAMEYADDYYDYNGFGVGDDLDGILFLIDMDNREAYISTSGIGIRYLTDKRIDDILDRVLDSGLSDGDFYNGTKGFLSATAEYLKSGIPGEKENSLTPTETIISLLAGLTASGGFVFGTKSKYKMKNPVKPSTFRNNSIVNFPSNKDRLVDSVISHRIIPKPSSNDSSSETSTTHTSSSGKTHGGGGKKF